MFSIRWDGAQGIGSSPSRSFLGSPASSGALSRRPPVAPVRKGWPLDLEALDPVPATPPAAVLARPSTRSRPT